MKSLIHPPQSSVPAGVYFHSACTREHYWEYDKPARPHVKACRACNREDNILVLNFPELAEEFDVSKNDVSLDTVTIGNSTKLWWKCKLRNHEFQKSVTERIISYGTSCKECKHAEEIEAYSLSLVAPHLATSYDERKNPLKASEISSKSTDIVHWKCDKGHEYTCAVYTKVKKNTGCNECARSRNQATPKNNLLVRFPELAQEFIDGENGTSPSDVYPGTSAVFSWKCSLGHVWECSASGRTALGKTCPQCKIVNRGFSELYPSIVLEFDLTKNGPLPENLLAGSSKIYWWKCSTLGHEWKEKVHSRTSKNDGKGSVCPQCAHIVPSPEYNAGIVHPHIVADYDTEKNQEPITAYLPGSTKKLWWKCSSGHSILNIISRWAKSKPCPECPKVIPVEPGKSLGEINPIVAKEFNVAKNGITPFEIMAGSGRKMFWTCSEGHDWQATVASRAKAGRGCPYCSGWKTDASVNLLVTHPEIAQFFDVAKNTVKIEEVGAWSHKNIWWLCEHGHSYRQIVANKTKQGDGCPYCSGRYATVGNNLAEVHPELAKEFDEARNGFSASTLTPNSQQKVWWRCIKHGHNWMTKVGDRSIKKSGCPYCANFTVLEGFNDLASVNTELTSEFDEEKSNFSPKTVTSGTTRLAYWKCLKGHSWQASVNSRARRGMGCPECSGGNSSKIEIAFRKGFATLEGWDVLDESNTKITIHHPKTKRMMVDIKATVSLKQVIVEYDGYYYHSGAFKNNPETCFSRDIIKTKLLLDNGYYVVRIREKNYNGTLDFLDMHHDNLFQIHHEYKGQKLDHDEFLKDTIYKIDSWVKSL